MEATHPSAGSVDPVGTIHTIDLADLADLAGGTRLSTHGVNVADAIALARRLDRSPRHIEVFGVVGHHFGHGPMSDEMRRALPAVVAEVAKRLGVATATPGESSPVER